MSVVLCTFLATPALADCSPREVLCAEVTVIDPVTAATFLQNELGMPLPKGLTIVSSIEGGFQDLFIEMELSGPPDVINAFLRQLSIDPSRMDKGTAEGFGIAAEPHWSLTADTPIATAEGILGSFAVARVGLPLQTDPDGTQRLFLLAFRT
jgi:hypothetical protein